MKSLIYGNIHVYRKSPLEEQASQLPPLTLHGGLALQVAGAVLLPLPPRPPLVPGPNTMVAPLSMVAPRVMVAPRGPLHLVPALLWPRSHWL